MIQPGGHETIYHGHDEPKSHYSWGRGKKERERGRREIEREKEVVYTLQTFFCAEKPPFELHECVYEAFAFARLLVGWPGTFVHE